MSRRTETAYKAKSLGKVAQDIKALDSGDMVNAVPIQLSYIIIESGHRERLQLLSGEICPTCAHQVRIDQQ